MDESPLATPAAAAIDLGPPPNRILVKEVNWLGDLVMSLSALRSVREAFPKAHLSVLIKEDLSAFFEGLAWIDEVLPYTPASGWRSMSRSFLIARELRAHRFDLAIVFPNSFESALWAALANIPRRAGYATGGRSLLLTHRSSPAPEAMKGHQSRYWLGMVRDTLGVPASSKAGNLLTASNAHVDLMRTWLTSQRRRPEAALIAVAPAAAYGPAKEWPPERYVELIDRIHGRHGAECVIIGAPNEQAKCERIAASTRAGAVVAAGQIGIAETIAILALSSGFAGNDSGAMHLAAALEIPTVGIFGSTNPMRTGPLGPRAAFILHPPPCNPCLARTCRYGHYDCLRATQAAEVEERLAQLGAFDSRLRGRTAYEAQ